MTPAPPAEKEAAASAPEEPAAETVVKDITPPVAPEAKAAEDAVRDARPEEESTPPKEVLPEPNGQPEDLDASEPSASKDGHDASKAEEVSSAVEPEAE